MAQLVMIAPRKIEQMKDRIKKLVEENPDLDHLRVKNSKNKNYLKME